MFESSCIESKYERYKPCDILSIDFLKKQIVFDMILVNKISDAEQFFLDINDGLDLKYYEIFKAELYHHANSVLKGEFKKFALKMENEWLKFFLQYRHSEDKWINGQKQNVIHHVEEEMLVFYLQYCFRMMWIEENGDDKKYLPLDVWWLKKEHFNRVEEITDFIIKRNTNANNKKFWISYSIKDQGQHWNIKDNHYNEMLHVFLKSLYNTKEINKDVIIWCYISNYNNKEWLSDYLRLVKKLLNNNRKENINATIYFKNWGIEHKEIVYARYYVQEIPKYYLESGVCEEYDQEILFDIIKMNKKISLNHNCLEVSDCLEIMYKECENELKVRSLLEKERKKLRSPDCKKIEEYENLSFINGLVDNFIEYEGQLCQLKEWAKNDENLTVLKNTKSKEYQYRDILKYICKNKIDIDNCKIKDVNIQWEAYTGTKYCDKGTLLIHTWCDLFTNKNGIKFSDKNNHQDFWELPEGWINNNYIIQPDDNKYTSSEYPKAAFAANRIMKRVRSLT